MPARHLRSLAPTGRIDSIRHACRGLVDLYSGQANFRFHVLAAAGTVLAGLILRIDAEDWRWIVLAIGWVWFAEAINTSIEHLCDVVTTEIDPGIRLVKDVAAAAVLISALAALIIGLSIFLPHI